MKTKLKESKAINKNVAVNDDPLSGDMSEFIAEGDWVPVKFEPKDKPDKVPSVRPNKRSHRKNKAKF